MKQSKLHELNNELKKNIDDLYQQDVPLVFGNGDPDSPIVLIGEAPGKNEVLQGKPFVGQAGKNLDEFINILEIQRTDLYITNVVKLRPFKINPDTGREANRPPNRKEIEVFSPFLKKEIDILRPKFLVTLGNVALKSIVGDDKASIGELHGRPMDIRFSNTDFVLFPLYHPASIIYKADLKEVYLSDLHKLREFIKAKNI